MGAFTSAQIACYNQETLDRLRKNMIRLEARVAEHGLPTRLYFSELHFDHIQETEVNRFLNSMPTRLAQFVVASQYFMAKVASR